MAIYCSSWSKRRLKAAGEHREISLISVLVTRCVPFNFRRNNTQASSRLLSVSSDRLKVLFALRSGLTALLLSGFIALLLSGEMSLCRAGFTAKKGPIW